MTEKKFDLNDITIIPDEESDISSRSECEVESIFDYSDDFAHTHTLPIIASPMDTVVSLDNYKDYINQNIIPCLPRGQFLSRYQGPHTRQCFFQSFGLGDIEKQLKNYKTKNIDFEGIIYDTEIYLPDNLFYDYPNVLIDMANAHMSKLIPIIKEIKQTWPNIKLMVGNVGNPETFINLAMAGADYVRIGIGVGCFIPGQKVKLKNKNKNIENIDIGDKVLTHLNDYKEVTNKFEYEINQEIYEINDIKCTENHEFFVIEKQYENIVNDDNILEFAKWIPARELDKNKHLLIKKIY